MGGYNSPFPDRTGVEMGLLQACVLLFRAILVPKARLAIENLALRQQVAVFKQSVKRPKLRPRDRVFWVCLSRLWSNWRSALVIVQGGNGHQVAPPGIQTLLALEIRKR